MCPERRNRGAMQSYGAGSWPTVGYSVSCHSRLGLTSLAGSNAKKPSQNQPNQTKPKRSEGNRKDWPETMGNKVVTFTEQELDDYQDCTFFTRKEILRVHKRFRELRPDLVPRQMTEGQASSVKVPCECIEKMPELRENPFRRRICEAFSRDGLGNLSFEDFLDALSVFSEQAPRDIKVFYAFKIYDFDQDGFIGHADLMSCLTTMTKNELSPEEHQQIADKVIEEADVDGDGKLSILEFEHVILRAPDFLSTFHIRI
ncbi:calcium and integrin-binding family member 2 isoform X1 [Drosophila suzukii]|uniref:Calcium and integrin-binding family member 2 isoform X1 n=2 Tax=suzukii subgroup TaxID=32353 RepID=A0AB39Z4I1_DROSZ